MGRVVTNGMTISYAREASPGVLPGSPSWFELEPNAVNNFGTDVSKTARTPISKSRVRRKGSVTDADSAVEFEADFTLTHIRHFIEQFLFAKAVGGDSYFTTAVAGGGYTVPALSAAQAGRMIYGAPSAKTLLFARGFATAANNGLKVLGAAPAGGATTLTVAGLTNEVPDAKAMSQVDIAGIRGAPGDLKIDANGDLTSIVLNFTATGITKGQVIHIGGLDVLNRFFTAANYGFARVINVAANKLTLSKRDQAFTVDDGTTTGAGGANVAIDILFGQFVRNVRSDAGDYLDATVQFELSSPNLMAGGATGYEYAASGYANALSIAIPLSGKATVTFGFLCQTTTKPATARAANAANAKFGGQTAAFGTASDIARLRVQDIDEAGLSTDFKSATMTLTNNVTAEKVLGFLGPKYFSFGDLEADVENQMLFTNADVLERIRCNKTVGFDWVLRNGDGGAAFDLPTGTMTGGGREYPANQSVLLNDTFAAHQEDGYGYTLGVSFFPALPAVAC